ncbi:MAG: C-GCAxxG-C-C family protein [Pseudomonadota bacterium]
MADTPRDAGVDALAQFDSGMFCAESVVAALAPRLGVPAEVVVPAATGFCSGVARTGGMCGAVSGAIMAIGMAMGRTRPDEKVERGYGPVQDLMARFAAEFGSTNCAELLGCHLGTPEGMQTFRDAKLGTRCRAYTRRAAELAAELVDARQGG